MCRRFLQLHKEEAKRSQDAGAATWPVTSDTRAHQETQPGICDLSSRLPSSAAAGSDITVVASCAWRPSSAAVARGGCWIWSLCALADDSCMQLYSHLFIYLVFPFDTIAFCMVSSRISPIRCNKVVSMATEKRVTDSQRCRRPSAKHSELCTFWARWGWEGRSTGTCPAWYRKVRECVCVCV